MVVWAGINTTTAFTPGPRDADVTTKRKGKTDMALNSEFRSMGVKCHQKTETREAGSYITIKMAVPHTDALFHEFVAMHGKQMIVSVTAVPEPEIAFNGSFEFAGVDIVTQTEQRSGGEFMSFRFQTPMDDTIFHRLEAINGNVVVVVMEPKQRDMFEESEPERDMNADPE